MSNPINLAINRQTRQFVTFNGSAPSVPDLFQSNVQDFRIQYVDPTSSLSVQFLVVDMTGSGMRMAVGDVPTGTPGGPTPLALQDTWTWDPINKWFTASLALNTSAVDTFLGTLSSKQAYLEINTTGGGNRITQLQTAFNLRAVLDELSSTAPNPVDQYLTKAEVLALFARKIGAPGERLVLVSADGTRERELGVNNDGSGIDNLI